MTRVAGVILAGGRARRLGGADKPLLTVGGRSILARILEAVSADLSCVAISANGDPARFGRFACPVLGDGDFLGQGPLAGILAGLDWAAGLGCDALLSVPGDLPFLPPGLPGLLAPAPACIEHAGRVQHLVALWPVPERDRLRALLSASDDRRVESFAKLIGMRRVTAAFVTCDPFFNVNTADDITNATRWAENADDVDRSNRRVGGDRTSPGPCAG